MKAQALFNLNSAPTLQVFPTVSGRIDHENNDATLTLNLHTFHDTRKLSITLSLLEAYKIAQALEAQAKDTIELFQLQQAQRSTAQHTQLLAHPQLKTPQTLPGCTPQNAGNDTEETRAGGEPRFGVERPL